MTLCRARYQTCPINGDVDAVVVHKIDRLARNMEDHVAIRALLRRRSVTLAVLGTACGCRVRPVGRGARGAGAARPGEGAFVR